MGTRSMIAFEDQETGAVVATYCHWDGYLEGVGKTLCEHYATAHKARSIAKGGYYSSLETTKEASLAGAANQDKPSTYESATAYFEAHRESWVEYLYLFRQGVWLYAEPGGNAGPLLVSAGDPNGESEEIWRNVAGVLNIGEKPRSYAIAATEGNAVKL